MKIELIHHTPLWVCAKAIRKCWASEDKSDSVLVCDHCYKQYKNMDEVLDLLNICHCEAGITTKCGEKDKQLIDRVGNKNKHSSTLEHLNYTFDIDGISRACLQELARHRHASLSVKSTRYTLKELKTTTNLPKFQVMTGNDYIDIRSTEQLSSVRQLLQEGYNNDQIKFSLPESYKTSLVWTINARSLQNFLMLRTDKAALWEIRDLANAIYDNLPDEHKYLFSHCIYGSDEWKEAKLEEARKAVQQYDEGVDRRAEEA